MGCQYNHNHHRRTYSRGDCSRVKKDKSLCAKRDLCYEPATPRMWPNRYIECFCRSSGKIYWLGWEQTSKCDKKKCKNGITDRCHSKVTHENNVYFNRVTCGTVSSKTLGKWTGLSKKIKVFVAK